MTNKLKVAVCQHKVVNNKEKNLSRIKKLISKAVKKKVQMVVLPEMFNCPYDNSYFPEFAENIPEGKTTHFLSQQAAENNIFLIGGSIPEVVIEGGKQKFYNTSPVFNPDGKLLTKHRKIHLFDIDLEEGVSFLESDTLEYGNQITVIETQFLTIGIAICYDLRFPELLRLMVDKGAEMIIIPGAFNTDTSPDHW